MHCLASHKTQTWITFTQHPACSKFRIQAVLGTRARRPKISFHRIMMRQDGMQRKGRTDLLMMLSRRECREELVREDCLLPARGCATNSSSLLPVTTHTATDCYVMSVQVRCQVTCVALHTPGYSSKTMNRTSCHCGPHCLAGLPLTEVLECLMPSSGTTAVQCRDLSL